MDSPTPHPNHTYTASIAIRSTTDDLPALMEFAEATADQFELPSEVNYAFQLAIEEICTNLIKYGYGSEFDGPIEVACNRQAEAVTIEIRDQSPPYDIRSAPQPDVTLGLPDRRPGGLGIYLVLKMMDDVHYHTDDDGWNTLQLIKRW